METTLRQRAATAALTTTRSAARPFATTTTRLLSLDVFRGLTILAMILVNNPGTRADGERFWPLDHATWGWTPTDLIFPFFLFMVGTSLSYSLRKYLAGDRVATTTWSRASEDEENDAGRIPPEVYWRIARRSLLLILLGLCTSYFSHLLNFVFGYEPTIDLATLRLPGILQRIGIVYFVVSLLALHINVRRQAIVAATILIGYWAILTWLPNPHDVAANLSPETNLVRAVDLATFGEGHLLTQATAEPTDPEGLLSTLPAIVTALFGYWTGLTIQRSGANWRTVALLVGSGALLVAAALLWNSQFPMIKKLWTSTFTLLAAGLAMQLLAVCLLVFDVAGWRRFAEPLQIVGVNGLFAFVASGLVDRLLLRLPMGDVSARDWLYTEAYRSWIGDPKLASLVFAATAVAFWWVVLWSMSRRGWSICI